MGRWTKGRALVGGSDWIVLQVMREGHEHLDVIAHHARMEPAAARACLVRLEGAKQVKALSANKGRRYVLRTQEAGCSSKQ